MEKQAKKFMKGVKSNFNKAKRTYVCRTLKDLIRAYRACTTKSEERALVKKEAAHIRDLFREGDKHFRRRNIAKLLFFHMNGYPTDFGITECIKLCASSNFADKRVAYLGLTILVDETEQILMLLTNSLKQDLNNADIHIVNLALNVVGDVASIEMLRELMTDIEKLLLSPNPNIRKKTGLVAVRAVKKCSDQNDVLNVLNLLPSFFDTRSSAVHISGTALISSICQASYIQLDVLTQLQDSIIPIIISILADHVAGASPSKPLDMYGSTHEKSNPFLIAKLITSLRLLFSVTSSSSTNLNPELTEKLSNLLITFVQQFSQQNGQNGPKIIQCAVLYEVVRISKYLKSHEQLSNLVVDILGKFLSHHEATVRYIALQELNELCEDEGIAILSGIDNIGEKLLKSLKETDPTVRKQAIDLIFRTTDSNNVEQMVSEIIEYVNQSEKDHNSDAIRDGCEKLFVMADDFGYSSHWKINIFVQTLTLGHSYLAKNLVTALVSFVLINKDIQSQAVQLLYNQVLSNHKQHYAKKTKHEVNLLDGDDTSLVVAEEVTNNENDMNVANDANETRRKRMPRAEAAALYIIGECGVANTSSVKSIDIVNVCEMIILGKGEDMEIMNDIDEDYNNDINAVVRTALTTLLKIASRELGVSSSETVVEDGLTDMFAELGLPSLPAPTQTTPLALPYTTQDSENSSDLAMQMITMGEAGTRPIQQEQQKQPLNDIGAGALVALGLGDGVENNGTDGSLVPFGLGGDALSSGMNETQGALTLYDSNSNSMSNGGTDVVSRVKRIFSKCLSSMDVEVQQRASEYLALLHESSRNALVNTTARSPAMSYNGMRSVVEQNLPSRRRGAIVNRDAVAVVNSSAGGLLLDLMDDADTQGANTSTVVEDADPLAALGALVVAGDGQSSVPAASSHAHAHAGIEDLLSLTMGEEGIAPTMHATTTKSLQASNTTTLGLTSLESSRVSEASNAAATEAVSASKPLSMPLALSDLLEPVPGEEANGNGTENGASLSSLGVGEEPGQAGSERQQAKSVITETDDALVEISLGDVEMIGEEAKREGVITITNRSPVDMTDCVLQLAVPKYMRLEMDAASSAEVGSGEAITQTVRLFNSAHGAKRLQFRYIVEFIRRNETDPVRIQGLGDNLP